MRIAWIDAGEEALFTELKERVESKSSAGVRLERIALQAVRAGAPWDVDIIVDRASQRLPFYRAALREAALDGVRVLADPLWSPTRDGALALSLLKRCGIATPPLLVLPDKEVPGDPPAELFSSLAYPLDWDTVLAEAGLPAWLKPHRGGRARKVHSRAELLERFDASGSERVYLQGDAAADEFLRVFTFGPRRIHLSRYDAASRSYPAPKGLDPDLKKRATELARRIERLLGLDFNRMEFAVSEGRLVVTEAARPQPRLEGERLGARFRNRLLESFADRLIEIAGEVRDGRHPTVLERMLAAGAPAKRSQGSRRRPSGKRGAREKSAGSES